MRAIGEAASRQKPKPSTWMRTSSGRIQVRAVSDTEPEEEPRCMTAAGRAPAVTSEKRDGGQNQNLLYTLHKIIKRFIK